MSTLVSEVQKAAPADDATIPAGPHLTALIFCERIDEVPEKGATLVDMASVIALPVPRVHSTGKPAEARVSLQLMVSAFAGGFTGDCPLRFVWGGDAEVSNRLIERAVLHFRWPDEDSAVTGKIAFHIVKPGTLTLDLYFGQRFVTRSRLRFTFVRAQDN